MSTITKVLGTIKSLYLNLKLRLDAALGKSIASGFIDIANLFTLAIIRIFLKAFAQMFLETNLRVTEGVYSPLYDHAQKLVSQMSWGADTQSYYGLARVEINFLKEMLDLFVSEKVGLETLISSL
jgi:hypothetical protein